jgi:diphthamide biosynthesis protein 4
MNAYELLECTPASSQDEIKTSYHRLLLIHHPDKKSNQKNYENSHPIDKFLKLQSAYKILSDPSQRLSYDSLLKQTDITNKAVQLEANDEDCLTKKCFMLNRDFELNDNNQIYEKKCRCGSNYKISVKDLNGILESHQKISINNSPSLVHESLVINVECDTCSLNINVLAI